MDLFPDGGFVRLRSRARYKYVHADEDTASVSLRPLSAAASMNAVWKVDIRPVEGGGNLLLLQGASYGRYLAVVSEEDDQASASSRHRVVRVVQRDYIWPELDPSCVWTPHKVESGQNYVRLHNGDQRCLRAKGILVTAHASNGEETTTMQWRVEAIPLSPEPIPLPPPPQTPRCLRANAGASNGGETTMMQSRVEAIPLSPGPIPLPPPPPPQPLRCLRANGKHRTADARNGDEITMMQRRVEAIPSTPQSIPLPPPPQPPVGYCCACECESSTTPLCRLCARSLKTKLLDAAEGIVATDCPQRHSYCLKCQKIVKGVHNEHGIKIIPVGYYKTRLVAWVTGDEPWSAIFQGIEAPDRGIKPYPLYTSKDSRCKTCYDIVSTNNLYEPPFSFCTLKCFVTGGGSAETAVENAMVKMDFSDSTVGFCLTCATPVVRYGGGKTHKDHDWVRMYTNSDGLWVIIPDGHPKEGAWSSIKKEVGTTRYLVRADSSLRCKNCHKRLASAGDSCTLQCSLHSAGTKFLPRTLQLV